MPATQSAKVFHPVTLFRNVAGTSVRAVHLTSRELELVRYLVGHSGRQVGEQELRDHLFNGICSEGAVRILIYRVRLKLGRTFIESDEGGYCIGTHRVQDLCARCRRPMVRYEDELVCYACVGTAFVDLEVGRTAPQEGTRQGQSWSEEERQFVLENDERLSLEEMGEALNRSASAVRGFRATLGLPRKAYVRRSQ